MQSWILSLMLYLLPAAPWADTYPATSRAIAEVVEEEPALFDTPDGKSQTAALLVAVAYYESAFRVDAVGDSGHSFGLYQRWGGGKRLFDPAIATRAALDGLRQSMGACAARPPADRLATYASGSCTRGHSASRMRMSLADRLRFVTSIERE